MQLNAAGIELIKKFEGFEPEPYICPGGKLTIGYGHVIKPHESFTSITVEQASTLLLKDCEEYEEAVRKLIRVPLNDNQFSALVSFTYNLGASNFTGSTLLKKVNKNYHFEVPNEFTRWVFANGRKLMGLLRRRCAEALLYVS